MNRWPAFTLLAALLVGCGAAGNPDANKPSDASVPVVSAGQLLLAPSQLPMGGVRVQASAAPVVAACSTAKKPDCVNFIVPVRLYTASAALPVLKVTGVYVITEGGVWRSDVQARDNVRCTAARCLLASARGAAEVQAGEAVQVVVNLNDAQGRSYHLRAKNTVIKQQ